VEELSELIKAITKMERMIVSGDDVDSDEALALRKNLIEEMADVLICIKQMMIFNSIQTIELQNMINKKIERNDQRYEKPENDEYDDELDSLYDFDFSNIEYDDDGNIILSSLNEEQLKIMVRVREKKAQGMSLGEIIESELKEMLGIKEDE
jgi:NTP pyrophosphatase (non-canonical NTP hydrolase)